MSDRLGRFLKALARPIGVATLALLTLVPRIVRSQDISCDAPDSKEVRTLNFEGNETFKDDELSAYVITTPSSFARRHFRWLFNAGTPRCFPADIGLGPDVASLKQFYKNNGFPRTQVDTVVTLVPIDRRGLTALQSALIHDQVDVTFRIAEGPPLLADSLRIAGLDSVDKEAILHDLPLGVGQRFGVTQMRAEIDSINSRLRNAGYPRAEVFPATHTDPNALRAEVELNVVAGTRARFGTINVRRIGVEEVGKPTAPPEIDSGVVLRLIGFHTGDWYSDRAIADGQRSLYNVGAYRHVGIEIDTTRQSPDSVVDLTVDVREDFMRQVVHEEGWATLDCFRLEGAYSDKNFADKALHLDLTGRLSKLGYGRPAQSTATRNLCYRPYLDQDSIGSSKLNYYVGATVRQPSFFGGNWLPAYSAYSERHGEYRAYLRTTLLGTDVSATRNIGAGMPLRFGYTLEYGQTEAEPSLLCSVFSRCDALGQADVQQRKRLAVSSVSFRRARTDNAVDPRSGTVAGAEVRASVPVIGSDRSLTFYKGTIDGVVYSSVSPRVTFVGRLRAGYVNAGGGSLVPPQERLYAGGATSVRGFQQNTLGPLVYLLDSASFRIDTLTTSADTTVALIANTNAGALRVIPTGGNRLVVINAEIRIRDPFFPELLEYVPFVDAGDVSTSEKRSLNITGLSVTPGFGVRYFSPVGPIQLNVGYNPSKIRVGQAYWNRSGSKAPLVCVSGPGAPVNPARLVNGVIEGNVNAECAPTFIPAHSSSFLNRLALTLAIGTDF